MAFHNYLNMDENLKAVTKKTTVNTFYKLNWFQFMFTLQYITKFSCFLSVDKYLTVNICGDVDVAKAIGDMKTEIGQ